MSIAPEELARMKRRMEDEIQVYHLQEVLDLIGTGVFNRPNPLFQAAITHMLVLLKDVTQFLRVNRGAPLVPNAHLPADVADLTEHILILRNAACHQTSGTHRIGTNTFTRNVGFGRVGVGRVDDVALVCEFEDDVAVFFGNARFYVARHAFPAVDSAAAVLGKRREGMRLIDLAEG